MKFHEKSKEVPYLENYHEFLNSDRRISNRNNRLHKKNLESDVFYIFKFLYFIFLRSPYGSTTE